MERHRMSQEELVRAELLSDVLDGRLSLTQASVELCLSYRQTRRMYAKYKQSGATALVHGLVGRPSNNKLSQPLETEILKLLREKYVGFGPTLASEHLAEEEGIMLSKERLRQLMHKNNIPLNKRKRSSHRSRRVRKERFGELLQIDGSQHDWFGTGDKCYIINLIDDATGENMSIFAPAETTEAAASILWQWIERYGVPQAIYADRKNVYIHEDHPHKLSVFGEMCERLGIALIPAYSPQAKGRIERSNGTHQDRLVKKMRLKGIVTIEQANEFLPEYFRRHNAKFTVRPVSEEDAHRPKPNGLKLADVCYKTSTRKIMNDWTVSYKGMTLQITKQSSYPPAKTKVIIHETLDGQISICYRDAKVNHQIVKKPDISTLLYEDISTLA